MPGLTYPAGRSVTVSFSGSFYGPLTTDAMFRSKLNDALIQQGFRVVALSVDTDWNPIETGYVATATLQPLGSMLSDRFSAAVRSAALNAGSDEPVISVTSSGEPAQPKPTAGALGGLTQKTIDAVGGIVEGVGGVAKSAGTLTTDIKQLSYVLVGGILILVALVAFGPNVKTVARSIR